MATFRLLGKEEIAIAIRKGRCGPGPIPARWLPRSPGRPERLDKGMKTGTAINGPQIHHLMGEKDLVGARGKAGYDGYGTNTTITNEVQSLCNRDSCHSSMGRSIALGA